MSSVLMFCQQLGHFWQPEVWLPAKLHAAGSGSLGIHSWLPSLENHPNKVQKLVNIHFMPINSLDCSICLFSLYGLLIMVGGVGCVGGDFSQTRKGGGG